MKQPNPNNYDSEEEYEKFINKNIVLKLTDASDEAKLLGVQINLDYEK